MKKVPVPRRHLFLGLLLVFSVLVAIRVWSDVKPAEKSFHETRPKAAIVYLTQFSRIGDLSKSLEKLFSHFSRR